MTKFLKNREEIATSSEGNSVEENIKKLKTGDLVAFFYRSKPEQFSFVIPFLKEGLEQNQRCLYIADDTPVGMILKKLEDTGVDVSAALKRGALDVLTKHETYLRHGHFEPEKMISDLELDVHATLAKGFSALRGSGDMSWALSSRVSLEQMVDYQARLNNNFPAKFLAVCQYDETRFPEDVLAKMTLLHDVIIRNGQLKRRSERLGGKRAEIRADPLLGSAPRAFGGA